MNQKKKRKKRKKGRRIRSESTRKWIIFFFYFFRFCFCFILFFLQSVFFFTFVLFCFYVSNSCASDQYNHFFSILQRYLIVCCVFLIQLFESFNYCMFLFIQNFCIPNDFFTRLLVFFFRVFLVFYFIKHLFVLLFFGFWDFSFV